MENNWGDEDARQNIVNEIMDTLHRHMPQTGVDGMQELRKIAIRFEEETFSNSQNQQDYLQKLSMKMLSLETKANNNNSQFPAGANQRLIEHTSVESLSQAGQPVIAERQEKVYQRLQAMKDLYFVELKDLFQKLNYRCQKPMPPDQSEKFKHYKAQLQRVLNYFNAPKNAIPVNFKEEHVEALEKRVQNTLNSFRLEPSAQQQPGQQQIENQMGQGRPLQQQSQPQMGQVPQEQKLVMLFQQMNLQPVVSSMRPDTVAPLQNSTMHLIQQFSGQASQQIMQTPVQSQMALNTQGANAISLQQSSGNQIPHNP